MRWIKATPFLRNIFFRTGAGVLFWLSFFMNLISYLISKSVWERQYVSGAEVITFLRENNRLSDFVVSIMKQEREIYNLILRCLSYYLNSSHTGV